MGCTVGRPPGGLTGGRGRGFLDLGGLRACEGVRGRARACFTLTQQRVQPSRFLCFKDFVVNTL